MSLVKYERDEVLFIKYNEETTSDLESLKTALLKESFAVKKRDTVLVLCANIVYSSEIGVVVQYLKTLPDTGRTLHLVVSNYVSEILVTMNIHKIPCLAIYTSLEAVQELFPGVDFWVV